MSGMMLHGLGDCTPEQNCGCMSGDVRAEAIVEQRPLVDSLIEARRQRDAAEARARRAEDALRELRDNTPNSTMQRAIIDGGLYAVGQTSDATPSDTTTEELRMTTNPYAEAVEAARLALQDRTGRTRQSTQRDAETAVDAATPRLLAPIRALASGWVGTHDLGDAYAAEVWQALDAIEAGATSEGGQS